MMNPIRNQGGCGSCWAFASVTVLETYYARKGNGLVEFSEQKLVDCDKKNFGCEGGFPEKALAYFINPGAKLRRDYPVNFKIFITLIFNNYLLLSFWYF